MSIWAISDPHLSFGVPSKTMEVFGIEWKNYADKIAEHWKRLVKDDDLVLIPGDISWGMRMDEALVDLLWIHSLPGTKVILRGNHDYWWGSATKMKESLPPSIHFIQNNAFNWKDVTIGGARLWDTPEFSFNACIDFQVNPRAKESEEPHDKDNDERIYLRELERLRMSLKLLNPEAKTRIALTHYPPIGLDLKPTRASAILEEFKIQICLFGHLHRVKKGMELFGEARGVRYLLTSCDYLNFVPVEIIR